MLIHHRGHRVTQRGLALLGRNQKFAQEAKLSAVSSTEEGKSEMAFGFKIAVLCVPLCLLWSNKRAY